MNNICDRKLIKTKNEYTLIVLKKKNIYILLNFYNNSKYNFLKK